ncbi:MAG: hypothetical protein NT062_15045 [Proteobacteria bacterium]|nr:hypothetical protein [Pseudomonadota bacterium]
MRLALAVGIIVILGLAVKLFLMVRDVPVVAITTTHPATLATNARTTNPGGGTPELVTEKPAAHDAWVDPMTPAMRGVKTSLRRQTDAIDSYVSDCVAKTPTQLSGTAHLTVAFARAPNGKVTVTSVGIDTEVPPTFGNATLLHCLQETGKRMLPDIPDDYVTVTAKHQVDLQNGNLIEHELSAFDVWRPGETEPVPH